MPRVPTFSREPVELSQRSLTEEIETIARAALAECDADCMTAVRRDASGVRHLAGVVADRAPKDRGVTWGMVEKICREVLGVES